MSAQTQPLSSAAAQPQPSPQLFFDTINSYQRTAALKTAIELDLFTAIGEGAHTPEAIALRCQASVRGVRMLADFLVVIGFLAKQDGQYGLTQDSTLFLNRHSPGYIGGAVGFIGSPLLLDRFNTLSECVRKGGTVTEDSGLEPDHPMWAQFARSMGPLMKMQAESIARFLHPDHGRVSKVLDLAAGHGMFGITVARHNPEAEIYAVDWPNVLQVAKEHAEQAGVIEQWHAVPGSAFEVDFGAGYDVVLITNLIHHFDEVTTEMLLRKVRESLAPNGRAVILEFVPSEDRVTPPQAAMFALTMLVGTPAGDVYTFAQYKQMCRNAGFGRCELHEVPNTFERLIVAQV